MDYRRMGLIGQQHPWSKEIPNFVKEMSFSDRLFIIMNEDSLALLSNALCIISKVEITEDLMTKALERLVKLIPQLRHSIYNYKPNDSMKPVPVFVEMINPSVHLEISENSDWKDEISKEWEKKYDLYKGPLWRVKLLPNVILNKKDEHFPYECVVIFSCSHIIFDGMSYQMVFGKLLDCLEDEYHNSPLGIPLEVFPSIDHYFGENESYIGKLGSFVVEKLINYQFGRKLLMILGGIGGRNPYMLKSKLPIDEDPNIPIQCKVFPVEFTKAETKQLTEACKSNGATVTGVLQIAASMAFASLIQEGTLFSAMSVTVCCPTNLRWSFGGDVKHALGNFAAVMYLSNEVTPSLFKDKDAFWKSVRACSSQIRQFIQQKDYMKLYRIFRIMVSAVEGTQYKLKEFNTERYGRNGHPLMITNMGNNKFLSRKNTDTFKLVDRFGGASEHNGGNIIMHNVNTFNDQMFMSLIYCPHIIKEPLVQKHADMIKSIIKTHCSGISICS